jgi:hypothetical protein
MIPDRTIFLYATLISSFVAFVGRSSILYESIACIVVGIIIISGQIIRMELRRKDQSLERNVMWAEHEIK